MKDPSRLYLGFILDASPLHPHTPSAQVAQSGHANPQLHLMCSTTLSFLGHGHASFAEGDEGAIAITRRLEASHAVERVLVSLVKARCRPGLQTVGCR